MANLIEEITNRLLLVNRTILSKKAPEEIVFEDASVLGEFFADFQYTNNLIDAAEKQAQENYHALIDCNRKLISPSSHWTFRFGNRWIICVLQRNMMTSI